MGVVVIYFVNEGEVVLHRVLVALELGGGGELVEEFLAEHGGEPVVCVFVGYLGGLHEAEADGCLVVGLPVGDVIADCIEGFLGDWGEEDCGVAEELVEVW